MDLKNTILIGAMLLPSVCCYKVYCVLGYDCGHRIHTRVIFSLQVHSSLQFIKSPNLSEHFAHESVIVESVSVVML